MVVKYSAPLSVQIQGADVSDLTPFKMGVTFLGSSSLANVP